jgi:hypothetical protein
MLGLLIVSQLIGASLPKRAPGSDRGVVFLVLPVLVTVFYRRGCWLLPGMLRVTLDAGIPNYDPRAEATATAREFRHRAHTRR